MYEVEVPGVGYSKFAGSDFFFICVGFIFILWSVTDAIASVGSLVFVGLAFVQALCGLGLVWVTVVHGRNRVEWEEWANPVAQWEAWQNHALFEGA